MLRPLFLATTILFSGAAFAKDPPEPCRTRSRQMTLVKNCYIGDMAKPNDSGAQFFASTDSTLKGVSYCYNSLISVEQKSSELRINVLKDSKDGKFHAYEFKVSADELKKAKKDTPFITLKGLMGNCYSKVGDLSKCNGGILKSIGLKEVDAPLILAMGKSSGGRYTVSHLVPMEKDVEAMAPKEIDGNVYTDNNKVTEHLLQDLRKKIVTMARAKMGAVHAGNTSPKKLASASEQFRYCTLAFEGFLRFNKLQDPFTSEEKMTLATLTNYMNDAAKEAHERMPASTPGKK